MAVSASSLELPRYSVLLVDDEPDVLERLRYEMEGFRVYDADGGDAALALCRNIRPDLVVTDIRMARGTGTELLRSLHVEKLDPMPIVLCITGYSDLRAHEAYDFGACAVFRKPFDMRDLMAASRRFLEMRDAEVKATQMISVFERDLRTLIETTIRVVPNETDVSPPLTDLREMTAMILHEINRPLSVVAMTSSLLVNALSESSPRLAVALKMASNVEASCQKLVHISRSMRELFLKIGSGQNDLHLASDLMRTAINHLTDSGKLYGVKVDCALPDRPEFVRGSAAQLAQVLVNLIENGAQAAAASADKTVTVTVQGRGEQVVFGVVDSGPGVPAALAAQIFQPFFSTKGAEGTGMGLAIGTKIAEAHKGTLTLVQGERGHGATFELALPRVHAEERD